MWRAAGSLALAVALIAQPAGLLSARCAEASSQAHAMSQVLPSAGAPMASQLFSITGRRVQGAFLSTFNRFGLESIGYPVSEERQEDGMTVQYFERVRMEYHPENGASGYSVLMTRLGDEFSKPAQPFARVAPFKSGAGNVYVSQTGHSLAEPFLSYWLNRGGVEVFGYPISEPVMQDGLRVQWFERARFEFHPELASAGKAVQLTLLGRTAYEKRAVHVTTVPGSTRPAAPAPAPAPAAPAPAVAAQQVAAKAPAPQSALDGMEAYLLKSVNEQRAAAGLAPVQADATLTEIARSRSGDMAARNYFSHTTPDGAQFFSMLGDRQVSYKYAGEILARNNYPDAEASKVAMDSYMNSAPHKAIIMDGRYNLVGVGYSKSGEDGMHYFTIIFIQR